MESRDITMPVEETRAPEAPSSHQLALTTNSPIQTANPSQMNGPHGFTSGMPMPSSLAKKKRGRPRKYGPDGVVVSGGASGGTLSPMPLTSVSSPPSVGYSTGSGGESEKKKKKKKKMSSYETSNLSLGDQITSGGSFTPHMVTVNQGEDVTSKIISFSKYGPRAICVLSARGIISHVTLRQANSSGGTVTYEGRFEILSLSGSFTPGEVEGISSREGGMSIALSSPDGRVVGGLLGGLLTAAGPVQVMVASFLPDLGNPAGPKPRKPKNAMKLLTPVPDPTAPLSTNTEEQNFNEQSQESPTTGNTNPAPGPNVQHENRSPMPTVHDGRMATDMNVSLRED